MRRVLTVFFVLIVLVAAGVVVFHRPSREQSKRALQKMTPQPLARIMKGLEQGKARLTGKAGNKDPNSALSLLERSLRLFKDLVSAVPEPHPRAATRRPSRGMPKPGPTDSGEDTGASPLSRLLNSDSTNFGKVFREILDTGFSSETLNANRDLLENLFPSPVPQKSKKSRSRR